MPKNEWTKGKPKKYELNVEAVDKKDAEAKRMIAKLSGKKIFKAEKRRRFVRVDTVFIAADTAEQAMRKYEDNSLMNCVIGETNDDGIDQVRCEPYAYEDKEWYDMEDHMFSFFSPVEYDDKDKYHRKLIEKSTDK